MQTPMALLIAHSTTDYEQEEYDRPLDSYTRWRFYWLNKNIPKMQFLTIEEKKLESDELWFNPGWFSVPEQTFYNVNEWVDHAS